VERKEHIRIGGATSTVVELGRGSQRYPCLSNGAVAFSSQTWREIQRGLKLSAREIQIVQGIFDNKLEYTIANELGVSVNTIRTELRRLRHKLNAADRVSVVLRVIEEFLRQTAAPPGAPPSIRGDLATETNPRLFSTTATKS
jgi:DNA-binding NarL/FixJ family response regulator